MGGAKRKRGIAPPSQPAKRLNLGFHHDDESLQQHPVLDRYYAQTLTFRGFFLTHIASRTRRRRLAHLGRLPASHRGQDEPVDVELGKLLDSTLVGLSASADVAQRDQRMARDYGAFSQQSTESSKGSPRSWESRQKEIVNFVTYTLFNRNPSHLLCHGSFDPGFSGIDVLCGPLWSRLLSILGHAGEKLMIEVLLYHGVFLEAGNGPGGLYQLSGVPLSDLKPLFEASTAEYWEKRSAEQGTTSFRRRTESRSISSIRFARNRMFYARAPLNGKDDVRFGLQHIHVWNRLRHLDNAEQTTRVMVYIFPRQFGMHNVFTSKVDGCDFARGKRDYSVREKEIALGNHRPSLKAALQDGVKDDAKGYLPKRLRGDAFRLVRELRRRHAKCAYVELLRHYCPAEHPQRKSLQTGQSLSKATGQLRTVQVAAPHALDTEARRSQLPGENTILTDLATPTSSVSSFCRAVVAGVIPDGFWGEGSTGRWNKSIMMLHIDRFIGMRRFESLTLHDVLQSIKIAGIPWLAPPTCPSSSNMSNTDLCKRREIFMEFVYYVFDSFLIPLVRSNFHVTESSAHKQRLFYFRHDTWRHILESSVKCLRSSMFDELGKKEVLGILKDRKLGFSQVRLLPKNQGVRPIANLRKRVVLRGKKKVLERKGVNFVMSQVFGVLNFEKSTQPHRLGSSLFSAGDIIPRLLAFRAKLESRGLGARPLYFAKVDVQSCFDTIPQRGLLQIMERLLSAESYRTGRHAEIRPGQGYGGDRTRKAIRGKPKARFSAHARDPEEPFDFDNFLHEELLRNKDHTVFVNSAACKTKSKEYVLRLLREHIESNIVKIDKTFYRQRNGIPQGSVLSTLLCSFFYSEFERTQLGFLSQEDSVLFRLVDDFLLVTSKREDANRFLDVMFAGEPSYGVRVKKDKTVANFEAELVEGAVTLPAQQQFPYCGLLINPIDLSISKDFAHRKVDQPSDSLTVDFCSMPGQTFRRRALNAFRIQMQRMFLDTSFNGLPKVWSNLYEAFVDAAARCFYYLKNMPSAKCPDDRLLIETVSDLIRLAQGLMRKRAWRKGWDDYECGVRERQTKWLAWEAFRVVFQRRQTKHRTLLNWLRQNLDAAVQPSHAGSSHRIKLTNGYEIDHRKRHAAARVHNDGNG